MSVEVTLKDVMVEVKRLRKQVAAFVKSCGPQAMAKARTVKLNMSIEELKDLLSSAAKHHTQIEAYLEFWKLIGPRIKPEKWTLEEQVDAKRTARRIHKKMELAARFPFSEEEVEKLPITAVGMLLGMVGINPFNLADQTVAGKKKVFLANQHKFVKEEWINREYAIDPETFGV